MKRPAIQENKITDAPKKGTPGKELLRFAGTISPEDCRRMAEAIEVGCERVDPSRAFRHIRG
jgi:hypothetical protein